MHPRRRDLAGAAILALILFSLVAVIVAAAYLTGDPAAHSASLGRPTVA
jgi:hypothetical protein